MVSCELSCRRTWPAELEYPVAYPVLICCKRRPRRWPLVSSRLIAFLRCALSARFHVGQPRRSGVTGIPGHPALCVALERGILRSRPRTTALVSVRVHAWPARLARTGLSDGPGGDTGPAVTRRGQPAAAWDGVPDLGQDPAVAVGARLWPAGFLFS